MPRKKTANATKIPSGLGRQIYMRARPLDAYRISHIQEVIEATTAKRVSQTMILRYGLQKVLKELEELYTSHGNLSWFKDEIIAMSDK